MVIRIVLVLWDNTLRCNALLFVERAHNITYRFCFLSYLSGGSSTLRREADMHASFFAVVSAAAIAGLITFVAEPISASKIDARQRSFSTIPKSVAKELKGDRLDAHPAGRCTPSQETLNHPDNALGDRPQPAQRPLKGRIIVAVNHSSIKPLPLSVLNLRYWVQGQMETHQVL